MIDFLLKRDTYCIQPRHSVLFFEKKQENNLDKIFLLSLDKIRSRNIAETK
jgi:hypothetical protein